MSRIPRHLEYLKTAATAEAVAAARFRAFSARADRDGLAELAARWRELAAAKDGLVIDLLEAGGQILGGSDDIGSSLAEERYENEVLYPKLCADAGNEAAEKALLAVVEAQKGHLTKLTNLRDSFNANPKAPTL